MFNYDYNIELCEHADSCRIIALVNSNLSMCAYIVVSSVTRNSILLSLLVLAHVVRTAVFNRCRLYKLKYIAYCNHVGIP
jgi:hypothetical protein